MAIGSVLEAARRRLGLQPESAPPEEENATLVKKDKAESRFVYDYGANHIAVETEFVMGGPQGAGIETQAAPPFEISGKVPEDFEEGSQIAIAGPHGPIQVVPPDPKPGAGFKFRCVPKPEFRVEIPPDAKPEKGMQIGLKRRDGVEVAIDVPPHLKPGDVFEVMPPALMVRVPDGAESGDFVVFRPEVAPGVRAAKLVSDWLRAQVPDGAEPGMYFAARLPVPPQAPAKSPAGRGSAGILQRAPLREGGAPLLDGDQTDEDVVE